MFKILRHPAAPPEYAMCFDPVTALAIVAGGTVLSAVGSISEGQAEAKTGRARARLLSREAARRQETAQAEASDFRRRNRRVLAAQRAGFAASGVSGDGTPLLVGGDTAEEIELQAQRILVSGLADATGLAFESRAEKRRASGAATRGFLSAGSTLLTGFGRAGFGSGQKTPKIPKIPTVPATQTGPGGKLAGPV